MKIGASVTVSPSLQRKLAGELGDYTQAIIEETRDVARKYTPKRSGSARKAWRVEGRGTQAVAVNDKPYIERLDAGSSRQAPQGIVKPTIREIRSQSRRIKR
jgi:hypothetical protein